MISAGLHSLTLTLSSLLPPLISAATAFASGPLRDGEPRGQGGAGRRGLRFRHFQRQTPGLLEGPAQSLRATNTWNAAVDVLFAAANRLLPHPRSVNCNHPTSHYHLPNDPARGEDLNTSTLNRHAYSHISAPILTENAHILSCRNC